jgi:mannose-6-phosphate isomerase-like protein (cupin superfamily)
MVAGASGTRRDDMRRIMFGTLAGVIALAEAATYTQTAKPPALATDITAAEVQAVLNAPSAIADRLIRAVDMGTYNVGVGVLRRGPTKPGAPVGAINHEHITEVYYIISGTGTLLTGGTVVNARPTPADSEIVKVVVGPSNQGTFKEAAQRRKVGPGDVVIIPPGVFHGFDEVTTGIDYLAVRPDPMHVLPTGYVHPAIKK